MEERNKGLARASCSTKEHIRHLLHAWRKALSAERIQAPCSTVPRGLAKSRARIGAHRRSSKQIPEQPFLTAWDHVPAAQRLPALVSDPQSPTSEP